MAVLESVKEIFFAALSDLDEPLVEYLATVVVQHIEDGGLVDKEGLSDAISELLIAYSCAEDEKQSMLLCENIAKKMKDEHIGKTEKQNGTKTHLMSKEQQKRAKLKVGFLCSVKYHEDGEWYDAEIDAILPDGKYEVLFVDYGNQEVVEFHDIKLAGEEDTTVQLLAAPVKIRNEYEKINREQEGVTERIKDLMFDREKNPVRIGSEDPSEVGLTSKQKKRLNKVKKKKEYMDKFDPRKWYEQNKMRCLPEWLEPAGTKMMDVAIGNFSMHTVDGSKQLLDNTAIKLVKGMRYGLVGLNGIGKTTLLRRISRYDIEEFPRYIRVLHVEQEIPGDDETVLQFVLKSDAVREHLVNQEKELIAKQQAGDDSDDTADELLHIHERMKELDIFRMENRASEILDGLRFSKEMQQTKTKDLSGGWRMRVSLACALFVSPDLLLLDEPTNHLDFPSVIWLEQYLQNYKKTLVIVSHDRRFLNNVITHVVHFHNRKLTYYKGDFNTFDSVRMELFRCQKKAFEAQQAKIKHIQAFIDKFRFNAKRASMVQSRIKTLENLEKVRDVEFDSVFSMTFPEPSQLKKTEPLVCASDLVFGYRVSRILINNVSIVIDETSRVGLMGANGVGKSTLLKLLLGELQPLEGLAQRNRNSRIAYFTQHHVDQLDLSLSPLDYCLDKFKKDLHEEKNSAQYVRSRLGRFGISSTLALQRMATLSGGQKSRVAFCCLVWRNPHLIIMDEPTNHLDLETIDALIEAIGKYKGGILAVSHDQHFLSQIAKEFWALSSGELSRFNDFEGVKKFTLKHATV